MTCVAFSIKFAKTNQNFAENSEFFVKIIHYYSKLFTSLLRQESCCRKRVRDRSGTGDVGPRRDEYRGFRTELLPDDRKLQPSAQLQRSFFPPKSSGAEFFKENRSETLNFSTYFVVMSCFQFSHDHEHKKASRVKKR